MPYVSEDATIYGNFCLVHSEIENTKLSQASLPYSRESTDCLFLLLPDTVQGLHLA